MKKFWPLNELMLITIPFFPGGKLGKISLMNLDLMSQPMSKAVSSVKDLKRSSEGWVEWKKMVRELREKAWS